MAYLEALWRRVRRDDQTHVALLCGDAGSGKTRLGERAGPTGGARRHGRARHLPGVRRHGRGPGGGRGAPPARPGRRRRGHGPGPFAGGQHRRVAAGHRPGRPADRSSSGVSSGSSRRRARRARSSSSSTTCTAAARHAQHAERARRAAVAIADPRCSWSAGASRATGWPASRPRRPSAWRRSDRPTPPTWPGPSSATSPSPPRRPTSSWSGPAATRSTCGSWCAWRGQGVARRRRRLLPAGLGRRPSRPRCRRCWRPDSTPSGRRRSWCSSTPPCSATAATADQICRSGPARVRGGPAVARRERPAAP